MLSLQELSQNIYLFITWKLILNPEASLRKRWDYFMMLVVIYNCITTVSTMNSLLCTFLLNICLFPHARDLMLLLLVVCLLSV